MRNVPKRGVFTLVAALAIVACLTGNAAATIGWAGNVWPLHNSNHLPTGPIDVYAQVWKEFVTDSPGQGADISAVLYYTPEGGAQQSVAMSYQGDVGNNDEYTAAVPQAALLGVSYVDVTVIFTDDTDGTQFEVTGDQANNPPPIRYNITSALPNDVDVTFTLCMSGNPTTSEPCVIGSAPEIGSWGTGVVMNPEGSHPDLFTVTVTFAAGSNPSFEYKYQRDGCTDWEFIGNRMVTLPTDGTNAVMLDVDSWNDSPLGCDLGDVLAEPKVVCFRVCMDGVSYNGNTCVIGSTSELGSWSAGVVMGLIGADLYEACITFPAGLPVQTVEYKFQKDDCSTWESVGNRSILIDNASPAMQTVSHTWDDGPGACQPVSVESSSWGRTKGLYR